MTTEPSAGTPSRAASRQSSALVRLLINAARTRSGSIGLALSAAVVAVAVVGPFVAPQDPTALVTTPFAPPDPEFLLGGDNLGRDVLSRVLSGGWVLLLMALMSTLIAVTVGSLAGMTAAYHPGWLDNAIMRTADIGLAVPQIVFALLFVSIIGPELWLVVLVVGLTMAPSVARVMRSASIDVAERDFVKAVELMGIRTVTIILRELLPNVVSPLMVETGLRLTYSIITIAGLSFLGFGQAPPAPNWGIMIAENRVGIGTNPWGVIVPAVVVAVLTVGTNLFTDAVARSSIDRRSGEHEPADPVIVEEVANDR